MLVLAVVGLLIAVAPAPAPADPAPPGLRLGDGVRPVRYSAELTVVPTAETFEGVIDIDVELRESSSIVWLNAEKIDVREASAEVGGRRRPARVVPTRTRGVLGLAFEEPLPKGDAKLRLAYVGLLSTRDTQGAQRQKEGDEWYVLTHFEPLNARKVFPCFDEPSFKTPWRLALTVRAGDRAFFNTPVAEERDAGNDMRRIAFAESKPLPSYLIAFAVGPFEVVDAGRSRDGVPLRIITPRGLGGRARWAAANAGAILDWQADYFGHAYAYEKLDGIAVPLGGGGMEHPGLITYGLRNLLRRPEDETPAWKRSLANLIAHEHGHLWFGDLVTLAWWDDLWLNEAFASWITGKTIESWQPTWGADEARAPARETAMGADSLLSARAIRQRIDSNDDIENAFDAITYTKGSLVIHMFEQWVGADVFRRGVQAYMKKHAHGNATAADFLTAISQAAERDVAPMVATFLDQPGLPQVSMTMQCDKGGVPRVRMVQTRYVPVGSVASAATASAPWQIPVCVRWGRGETSGRACTVLAQKEGTLALEGAASCPEWLEPNEGASGYYRPDLDVEWLERLVLHRNRLTNVERIALVGDLGAVAHAGRLPYATLLPLLAPLAADSNRRVVAATVRVARGLWGRGLLPPDGAATYAQFVQDVYGARARDLGWPTRAPDDEETRLLRVALVPFVADEGQDAVLAAEARRLADAWLADRRSVDAEIVEAVLGVAAAKGDVALFEKWHEAARKADRTDRGRLLLAIGSIPDPSVLKRAMAITLQDEFEPRESMMILAAARSVPTSRALVYDFVKSNFDALEARLPPDSTAGFPAYASAVCDESVIADAEQFFKDRSTRVRGGPRSLAQSLESLRLCVALRKTQAASVADFLERYPGKGTAVFRSNGQDERR